MRLTLLFLLTSSLAVTSARSQPNVFGLFPDEVCATSRAVSTTVQVDLLTLVDGQDLRGVGQSNNAAGNTVGRVSGFRVVIQDQNGLTSDPFTFVVVPEDHGTSLDSVGVSADIVEANNGATRGPHVVGV